MRAWDRGEIRGQWSHFVGLTLALVALTPGSALAAHHGGRGIDSAATGPRPELVESVPITKPGAPLAQIVLSIDSARLPSLEQTDQLITSAELEVTTDCLEASPRCAGHVYHYAPKVTGTIALLDGATGEATAVGSPQQLRCLQRRPDRQHHCVLVFPSETTTLGKEVTGCEDDGCSLVLEITATNRHAGASDRLVIGNNRPNGSVSLGHARLGLIRIPVESRATPSSTGTDRLRYRDLPLGLQPRSVLSLRLPHLHKGERLAVDAGFVSDVKSLHLNALVSASVVLAERPGDTRSKGLAGRVAAGSGEISPANGSNCTLGQSPCTTLKAGILSVRRDARSGGKPVPLFLNVVVRAKPKVNATARGSTKRLPIGDGSLTAVSYSRR